MALNIRQSDIDKYHAERARLEPIAKLCGVAFDEDNFRLMQALQTIAYERNSGSKGPSQLKNAEPGSQTAQAEALSKTIQEAKAKAKPTGDLGDKVVAQLVAMGVIAGEGGKAESP